MTHPDEHTKKRRGYRWPTALLRSYPPLPSATKRGTRGSPVCRVFFAKEEKRCPARISELHSILHTVRAGLETV